MAFSDLVFVEEIAVLLVTLRSAPGSVLLLWLPWYTRLEDSSRGTRSSGLVNRQSANRMIPLDTSVGNACSPALPGGLCRLSRQ